MNFFESALTELRRSFVVFFEAPIVFVSFCFSIVVCFNNVVRDGLSEPPNFWVVVMLVMFLEAAFDLPKSVGSVEYFVTLISPTGSRPVSE